MWYKNLYFLLIPLILGVFFASVADAWTSDKTKLIHCKKTRAYKGKACIVGNVHKEAGTIISVYDSNHYWVTSGYILKKSGSYALVIFKGKNLPTFKRYYLEDAETIKWKHSYTDAHLW